MGFSDRDYNRDEPQGFSFGGSGGGNSGIGGGSTRSIVNTLVFINIGVFLVDWLIAGGQFDQWFAVSNLTAARPWLWFQYLTYGFLHAQEETIPWHIIGNMFVLWMFGRQVEYRYGSKEFLRFYLITIVVGGILYSLLHMGFDRNFTPEQIEYFLSHGQTQYQILRGPSVVGASGGVVAILILFICNYPKQKLLIYGVFPVPAWVVGIFIIGSDIFGSFDEKSTTAHSVHLAGIVIALAYFYGGWNFSRIMPGGFSIPKQWFKSKPKLRVHAPDETDRYAKDDQQGDKLLAKVEADGIDSLTAKERKQLDAYSRRMKQKHR
ncbi:MAG: rhomboid family intramembrane serine protease [Pirellulales bacterium]|jgi:membrane associated rhomboid family serine protease